MRTREEKLASLRKPSSCDFKPGKKRWAGALLSEKCCCFVLKPSWVTQIWTSPSRAWERG